MNVCVNEYAHTPSWSHLRMLQGSLRLSWAQRMTTYCSDLSAVSVGFCMRSCSLGARRWWYLYACMYVYYMCMYMHIWGAYACMYVYYYMCMYVCMYIHSWSALLVVPVCMYVCSLYVYVCVCMHIHIWGAYACMYVYYYMCMYVCVCIYIYGARMHVCMFTICVCMSVYVYTYMERVVGGTWPVCAEMHDMCMYACHFYVCLRHGR